MDTPTEPGRLARARVWLAAHWHRLAVPNWRLVLRHAWSVWLDVLGIVLTVLQTGVDMLAGSPPIAPLKFAVLAMVITLLSLLLRLVRQDTVDTCQHEGRPRLLPGAPVLLFRIPTGHPQAPGSAHGTPRRCLDSHSSGSSTPVHRDLHSDW